MVVNETMTRGNLCSEGPIYSLYPVYLPFRTKKI